MSIGEKIKQLRQEMGLSQKALSEKLSIGHSTLACYETNKRQVSLELLTELANFFGVTTDYLLGREG